MRRIFMWYITKKKLTFYLPFSNRFVPWHCHYWSRNERKEIIWIHFLKKKEQETTKGWTETHCTKQQQKNRKNITTHYNFSFSSCFSSRVCSAIGHVRPAQFFSFSHLIIACVIVCSPSECLIERLQSWPLPCFLFMQKWNRYTPLWRRAGVKV